ncbi:hypothetical protein ACFL6L_02200 [candidate division KSB1 bacterium]
MIRTTKYLVLLLLSCFASFSVVSQAPPDEFFHSPSTVLPYAKIMLILADGESRSLPFTPILVNSEPIGVDNFSKDIDLRGRLVFAGNGIVDPDHNYNSLGTYDFNGRIPIIIYNIPSDFQDKYGERSDLHIRVFELVQRGAVAVILFGIPGNQGWNAPFLELPETIPPITVPVTLVSFDAGIALLDLGGINLDLTGYRQNKLLPEFEPIELPIGARLTMKGAFKQVGSEKFNVRFLPGILQSHRIERYVSDKNRALTFIEDLFMIRNIELPKENIVFFPDFTSLRFYTGKVRETKNDSVSYQAFSAHSEHLHKTDFLYFVKELTPQVMRIGWGNTLPGMESSITRLTEEFARDDNSESIDKLTAENIIGNKLRPLLSALITKPAVYQLLPDSVTTAPASFMKYLWSVYSQAKFKRLYLEIGIGETPKERLELFETIYLRDFMSLEREWMEMLAMIYDIPNNYVDAYNLASSKYFIEVMSGK